ncbi:hypothetical protein TruAng_004304 [Truncatella angustata]|nr:hypothetical protein TruAng_004304 [Truncatella angustata]
MKTHEAVGIATTVVATVFVGIRLFTRVKITHDNLGLSDYLNIAALISAWIFAILIFPFRVVDPWIDRLLAAEAKSELTTDPELKQFFAYQVERVYERGFNRFNAVTSIFFALALTFARLSILVFYLRLSPVRSFHWAVHAVSTFLGLNTSLSVVLSLLVFDNNAESKIRAADQALSMFYGISNILVDVAILLLPIGVVWALQMAIRRKIAIICLFGVGAIVCAISTYRVTILTFISSRDTSSNPISNQLTLSFAETNGAIICGCVPITTRFFTQFLPELLAPYLRQYSKSPSTPHISNGGTCSTTIEKNRRRRENNKRRNFGFRDSGFASGSANHPGSRENIVGAGQNYEMAYQHIGFGRIDDEDPSQSYDSLERNVLGKGRAGTLIRAQTEVFAPDQELGITCIYDTSDDQCQDGQSKMSRTTVKTG